MSPHSIHMATEQTDDLTDKKGECCVFNQYGNDGCDSCIKGAGPHLDFNEKFGDYKAPDMPIQPYVDKNGRVFFRFWAIGPGVNRHEWGVDGDYIAENMPTIVDTDITYMVDYKKDGTPYYPHPAIPGANAMVNQQFQKNFVVGKGRDWERKPDENGNWYGIGEAIDPMFKEFLMEEFQNIQTKAAAGESTDIPIFVSPQVLHYEKGEDPQKIKHWWFQHVTITNDPAYPPALARITGSCVGDEGTCMGTLKQASMTKMEMGCVKTSLQEMVKNNRETLGTILDAESDNTSLISKQGSLNLDNFMVEQNDAKPDNPQTGNANANDKDQQTPQFQQPQDVDSEKVNEHIKEMVAKMITDQSLTAREKELLTQVDTLTKTLESESSTKKTLQKQIKDIEQRESRRDIELLLIPYEKAFTKEGKFDEKAFNEEVDYWMGKNEKAEDIKKDIERAMRYSHSEPPTSQQYASGAGQSSEGHTIYGAPEVGANLPKDEEDKTVMKNAAMEQVTPYYGKKGGRLA